MIEYKDKTIPLAAIVISPCHRMRSISAEDKKEIGASLAKFGQLQQLLVRPVPGKRKDMYELLAGRMRFEAMKAEGIKMARCAVTQADDRTAEIISIIENLHRRLNTDDERRKDIARYTELVSDEIKRKEKALEERHKVSGTVPKPKPEPERGRGRPKAAHSEVIAQVTSDLPVSVDEVRKIQQIQRNLCPSACRALDRKKITFEQALMLSRMPLGKQRDELQRMVNESQLESRERVSKEKLITSVPPTEAACRMLKRITTQAKDLYEKAEELLKYTHGKAIDWETVQKTDVEDLHKAAHALLDLKGLVDTASVN